MRCFGRYTLRRRLGQGGMGVVWLARDEKLERDVALKFLSEGVRQDLEAVGDLKIEVRRCLELTHPHIVRVYDLVEDARAAAIAMEYLAGGSLGDRKTRQPRGCFEAAELAPLVVQLCSALGYAHRVAKIVHRDLKPANLLLSAVGVLKIADFGIARSLAENPTRLTRAARENAGTLSFAGPQQLEGARPSPADDIYSLGATLYDLLTGKPPFFRGDVRSQIEKAAPQGLNARRAELGCGAEAIPRVWEETILACLAKRPDDRPESVGEIVRQLGLQSEFERTELLVRQAPAAIDPDATEPGAAAISIPSGSAVATGRPSSGNSPAQVVSSGHAPEAATTPKEPRIRFGRWLALASLLVVAGAGAGYYFTVLAPERAQAAREKKLAVDAEEQRRLTQARGGVVIRTSPPGAEVIVDTLQQGTSPLTLRDVKLGEYSVKATAPGYEEWRGTVEVKENKTTVLPVTLKRSVGKLAVVSDPAGLEWVLAGSDYQERGPADGRAREVPTGNYTLTVSRPGFPDVMRPLEIKRGAGVMESVAFVGGSLAIDSTPSGAEVWQEDVRVGTTPYRVAEAPPGRRFFSIRLKGFKEQSVALVVTARQPTEERVTLEKLRSPENGQPWIIPDLGTTLVPIRPGTFWMGSAPAGQGDPTDEEPRTHVTLTQAFWLGKTEVTQREWQAVMGSTIQQQRDKTNREWPLRGEGPDYPMYYVSWNEAMEFCRKLTAREAAASRLPAGYVYTLPTEAQWEYACRAGTPGDYAGDLDALAWYGPNSSGAAHVVGTTKKANDWGLHDMHGNVWEWCYDRYGSYPGGEVRDPAGPVVTVGVPTSAKAGAAATFEHVFRGGSWNYAARNCRSAVRSSTFASRRSMTVGFRIALAPEQAGERKAGPAAGR